MGKTVRIDIPDDEQYERLSSLKEERGLTWRGMLILAADEIEAGRNPDV